MEWPVEIGSLSVSLLGRSPEAMLQYRVDHGLVVDEMGRFVLGAGEDQDGTR